MTEQQILSALSSCMHCGKDWAFFEQLRTGVGFSEGNEQVLDAYAIALWIKAGRRGRYCYEVKTSRTDFFREIKAVKKRRFGLMVSNYFYFAAPLDLIKANELPIEAGLVEVQCYKPNILDPTTWRYTCRRTIQAPFRESFPAPWDFVASIARRACASGMASPNTSVEAVTP
jgi:hypothetical protein